MVFLEDDHFQKVPTKPLSPIFMLLELSSHTCCTISDDETDGLYVDPDITDSVNYQQPVMPPIPSGLSRDQVQYFKN